ncbi:MAG: leucine--tRNA ligase [Nanoarchaeota archaeon]|nr:leucine--tRNA ligase [Nanoarchaeota archaeon]MBU1631957.1 leucine--tRNA ligase [Nanoarchaeota archaeon]MBU1876414.1 leucine--tRNA ligase [Nanoarchaeota archaeon]
MALDWNKIQDKWQDEWDKAGLGKAIVQKNKEKFMIIFAYPGITGYPHVGHMRGYSYTDMIARYHRLKGKEVLFPIGTHASGNHAYSFANKIKNKDQRWIDYLLNNGCPEEKLKELENPHKIIEYFNKVFVNDYFKKFGFICDWDRFLCTTHKDYEKFIQWQFKKLQQKDLLIQKPYFATACINCGPVAVDPSETDISKGGNAEKNEYTLLKFKFGNDYLVAATLRPETIYGQTNLWINPEGKYVRVEVENENWILSEEAAEKLKYQKDDVLLKEFVDVKTLIGKFVLAPGIDKEIIILPASFVDPKVGSGIVTCVPSDAPYDYVALKLLQDDEELCKKHGLDPETVKSIQLIPIITAKGYELFPAKEIVGKMNITSLEDPKLEEATKEIYKVGFHSGIMKDTCGKFAGKRVEEAKELMKAELIEEGHADLFHDLSEEVICRCGSPVVIKKIDDQWFIKYSDPELTERSKEQAKEMNIYPKEYQDNLPSIIDWFGERACARLGNWLGSKFPFDESWTIEPISDSTLYPVYYIVSKFFNDKTIALKDLTTEFFDYVFLGEGEGKAEWKPIREEFDYFYPLDINLGGKEHKTVHFPVFLMNHVAILPESKWPRGIFVNWWVTGKGGKISKSKGGAEPIPNAMKIFGVDAMRFYYAHIGSPHVDVIWDEEVVINYRNSLERIHSLVIELKKLDGKKTAIDDWMVSRINEHIKNINGVMERYDLRELASIVYYTIYDDLKWYLRRRGNNKKVINEILNIWCRLMNPITPHLSEELNDLKGELVSASIWPQVDNEKISRKADAGEELIRTAMEGMRNVLKLAKLEKPTKFTIFIAETWLYDLFNLLSHETKVTRNIGEIMKNVLEQEELKMKGKEISKLVQSIVKDVSKLPFLVTSSEDELKTMREAKDFLEKEFNCEVEVLLADESDHPKAKSSMPGKVGILIE